MYTRKRCREISLYIPLTWSRLQVIDCLHKNGREENILRYPGISKWRQAMTQWTSDELNRIGTAEELEIASLRGDDTLRKPVVIWVVRVSDDLYVRSVKGRISAWFRGVRRRYAGQIRAGGVVKDV